MSVQKIKIKPIKQRAGAMAVNTALEDVVQKNSLLDFDHVMSLSGGEVVKQAVPERNTVRLCLKSAEGPFEAFLKRHYPLPLLGICSQILKLCRPKTAFDEFRSITAFHRAGIATMTPVAAGKRRCAFLGTESFLVTKAIAESQRLDHLFNRASDLPAEEKRDLVKRVALLVKKMHACGFNHRDLYLCHILLDRQGQLFLVDLHRVDHRQKVPERWKVKDIAALNYSAPGPVITRTDRLRFLKAYLGKNRLSSREKLFVLKVLKKTQKMLKHNRNRERL
jgi:tRNA A-37 threonylcarbamoyl transferase component Bud32